MILCSEIKVRGYHLDLYGHVNNSRYLEFLEEARWALFDDRIDVKEITAKHLAFLVVNININYRVPANEGDTLEIFTGLKETRNKSVVLRQEVRKKDTTTVIADADVTFVIGDMKTGGAVPLDNHLLAILENLPK